MSHSRVCALSTLAAVIAVAFPADAQSVISTHSGVIYFFEGAVYLGDQRLEAHLGKFPSIPQGAEFRTAEGRAEVLLTPGVFLRMGERSSIRMVTNQLADTQVELQGGSAIVDSGEPNSNTSVTVIYKDWRVHLLQKGVYRIDTDPPRLSVNQGEAEVFVGDGGPSVSVDRGMDLPFAKVPVPERSTGQTHDALSDWAGGRNDSIYADNAITSQIDQDPAAQQIPGMDAFTYFPVLGMSPLGISSPGLYSAYMPYQPGFSSIYLPGYTYQPLMLGLVGTGLRTFPSSTLRFGTSPGIGIPRSTLIPRSPIMTRPVPIRAVPHMAVPAHR